MKRSCNNLTCSFKIDISLFSAWGVPLNGSPHLQNSLPISLICRQLVQVLMFILFPPILFSKRRELTIKHGRELNDNIKCPRRDLNPSRCLSLGEELSFSPRKGRMIVRTTPQGHVNKRILTYLNIFCLFIIQTRNLFSS